MRNAICSIRPSEIVNIQREKIRIHYGKNIPTKKELVSDFKTCGQSIFILKYFKNILEPDDASWIWK